MRRVAVYVVVSLLVLAPLVASAQDEPPSLVNMSITQVKSDMTLEHEALRVELKDALREAGLPFYLLYRVARGNTNEYVALLPFNSFADFDGPGLVPEAMGPAAFAQWSARIGKVTVSRHVDTLTTLLDHRSDRF